ncbi:MULTISPECIES: methylenetetrahydrofolate reductase [unclassified Amycolatopsis]|uniref:methylenetetrahydrofolate reductase n=1 Tax=unclassified Amycolatopsis TaxID=2618356 RepID=UPI001C69B045|nr:methylenetetrahydrofolate reductase [Amycolatopsis sp. DSM 110486]QYN20211.1 methylenetetrahydrofolate reductase [Amycolatopsis sp. DSM 110486]
MHLSLAVDRLVRSAHIEAIPLRGVQDELLAAPAGTTFTVTCSSKLGLERTVEFAELLAKNDYSVIPHLAARQVTGRGELAEFLERLGNAGITDLFVVGGDAVEPAGPYSGAADLLEALPELDHGITSVGVGCYPEGHPQIPEEELLTDLLRKQDNADYMVSQLCFDVGVLLAWLRSARSAGVILPLWIGLAGPVQIRKLVDVSLRIGVGSSLRYLRKQHGMIRNLVRGSAYRPEELLSAAVDELGPDNLGIEGIHLFSFNQIESATSWQGRFAK